MSRRRLAARLNIAAIPIVAFTGLASTAHGQSMLYTFDGDSAGDFFGWSVSGAGDVNGDGYEDVIVGARYDDNNGTSSGSASVFSGADGSVLYTFYGDSPDDQFGYSVSCAGDVNGDGYGDMIVGAVQEISSGAGYARVFSGADGSTVYTFDGDSPEDGFGVSVSGARDVNGDGYHDLIVGAYGDDNNGGESGSARVLSGIDGSTIYTFNGDSKGDRFGVSVSGAGDVNGDGFDDLIVGAVHDDNNGSESGSALVFSGKDGSVIYTFDGDAAKDFFGFSVSGAGDVNGDGFHDLIGGASEDDNNGVGSGSARVFSGLDGSILYTFDGDSETDRFGWSVSGAGDVNGDGFADLIVGAIRDDPNGMDSGSARVLSGLDGSVLYALDGDSAGDWFGVSVSGAGDVNGDGFDDVIVGAHDDDPNGGQSGSARVFSGCDALGTSYCIANSNSSGVSAFVVGCGSPAILDNYVVFITRDAPVNQFGYYLMSAGQDFVPLFGGSEGNLCLGPPIYRFNVPPWGEVLFSGDEGVLTFQPDLTNLPQGVVFLPGETWNFQSWFRDVVGGNFTSNTSDGLAITWQ